MNYPQYFFYRMGILWIFLSIATLTFGQNKTITVNAQNATIKEIFSKIQEQSEYRFFYSDDIIDTNAHLSIVLNGKNINETIEILNSKTNLSYKIVEEKMIVVSKKETNDLKNKVKGRVLSASDQQPLPGVNIVLKGTTTGVISDFNGYYEINIPDNTTTLVFSFIGYKKAEAPIDGKSILNVSLEEDFSAIDEVVVTALNISRDKNSLGYSISVIDGNQLNQAKENNMINTLSGKVAGLQISKAASGVDGSSRVVLRGISSLLGNNRPLVVVDGIPMDAGYGGAGQWGGNDMGDALSDINPEDIATVSVLKGAGAAAAYGSRGANGVILMTTKKGAKDKGLGISFSSNYSIENPMVYPDLQNVYGQGSYGVYPQYSDTKGISEQGFPWGFSWGPKMEGQILQNWVGKDTPFVAQPNNFKDFFVTGTNLVNSLAFESATEKSSFRASLTNQNSQGIISTNDMNKQTFNLRGTSKFGNNIELDGKVTYIHHKVNDRPYLTESSANHTYMLSVMPRNINIDDLRNNTVDKNGKERLWVNDVYTSNPYWQLENVRNKDEKHHLQSFMSVKVDFSQNLNLLVRSGMDYSNTLAGGHVAIGSPYAGPDGYVFNSQSVAIENNSDLMLNYKTKLTNQLNFNLSGGGNIRYNRSQYISQSGSKIKVPGFYAISNVGSYNTSQGFNEKKVYSAYSLGQLSFSDYLYFDFTLRNDWSSTLPLKNNSYFYHSENLSFLFTKALGIKSPILSSGKIRGSFAKVGNDTGAYATKQYYSVTQSQLPYPIGSFSTSLPFFDLEPEMTGSWEVGTELALLNNRINLDFTYYRSLSDNQIINAPLPTSTGYWGKLQNAGKIRNIGYELQMSGSPIQSKTGLNWDVTLTWSKNKSMVIELYQGVNKIILDTQWHGNIEARPGEEFGGIYTIDYKRDNFGRKLIDESGFAQAGEYKKMGSINPDWMAGLNNKFSYRNFSLNFLVDFHIGGDVYSQGKAYKALFGTSVETLEGREEWLSTHDPATSYQTELSGVKPGGFIEEGIKEKNGQVNDIPIQPFFRWYNLYSKQIGTEWIQDATNIRLRELVLGYNLPRKWLSKVMVKDINLSMVGRNLFFFYRAMDHVDPESGYSSGNTGGGFEHSALPSLRSIGFNLRVNF